MNSRYECIACDGGEEFDLYDGYCYRNSDKIIQKIYTNLYYPAIFFGVVYGIYVNYDKIMEMVSGEKKPEGDAELETEMTGGAQEEADVFPP